MLTGRTMFIDAPDYQLYYFMCLGIISNTSNRPYLPHPRYLMHPVYFPFTLSTLFILVYSRQKQLSGIGLRHIVRPTLLRLSPLLLSFPSPFLHPPSIRPDTRLLTFLHLRLTLYFLIYPSLFPLSHSPHAVTHSSTQLLTRRVGEKEGKTGEKKTYLSLSHAIPLH